MQKIKEQEVIECRSRLEEKVNADAITPCEATLFSATWWTLRYVGPIRMDDNLGHYCMLWELNLDSEKKNLMDDVKGHIVGVNKKSRKLDFVFIFSRASLYVAK